ncbi:MAG: SCO family protein [Myxococcota bacterium]
MTKQDGTQQPVASWRLFFRRVWGVLTSVWLWAVLSVISVTATVMIWRDIQAKAAATTPPTLAEVGTWSLTDHEGRSFGGRDLEGKVWVATFFFTRCPTICPKLMRDAALLRRKLARLAETSNVALVSFTVDPEHDTPRELAHYRSKLLQRYPAFKEGDQGSAPAWTFVTGTRASMLDLVRRMKLHLGDKHPLPDNPSLYDIGHVAQFALFDRQGNLRGLFPTDKAGRAEIKKVARRVLRRAFLPKKKL